LSDVGQLINFSILNKLDKLESPDLRSHQPL